MDFIAGIALLLFLSAAFHFIWHRVVGWPRTPLGRIAAWALVIILAVVTAGVGVYKLSKSRTFQVAGTLVPRVATDKKLVALTLDDGPTAEYTNEALTTLAEQDVKATFYLTGTESQDNPEELRAIIAAGHELGNHTYDHQRMVFISTAEMKRQIDRTDEVFRKAGYTRSTTFRQPGCKRLLALPLLLAREGRTTVTWDFEPDSGPLSHDAQAMADEVVNGVRPGSIILMHVMYESREPSREALPDIIERLKAKGYRFVTVSELLAERAGD